MYATSQACLSNLTVNVTVGVKQDAPSSSFVFVLFINPLIRQLKQLTSDSFWGVLHGLFMMDVTVLFATSCDRCAEKLEVLSQFCHDYGMIINNIKTKFMVINRTDFHKEPLHCRDISVNHCEQYIYLGSVLTADEKIKSALKEYCREKFKHKLKYAAFIQRNLSCPIWVKKLVLRSAFISSILYGCETWLTANVKVISTMYTDCLKNCLSVRRS